MDVRKLFGVLLLSCTVSISKDVGVILSASCLAPLIDATPKRVTRRVISVVLVELPKI